MQKQDESISTELAGALSALEQMRLAAHGRIKVNRDRILKALKNSGATSVLVNYSGSGDNGQIDDVTIYQDKAEIQPKEQVSVLVATSKWNHETSKWDELTADKSMSLAEALEGLVYDWLEAEHSGWVNDDGASGECNIDVAEDQFLLSHTTYYTEGDTTEHEL